MTHPSDANDATVIPAGVWHQSSSTEDSEDVTQIVLLAYNQEAGSVLSDLIRTWWPEASGEGFTDG